MVGNRVKLYGNAGSHIHNRLWGHAGLYLYRVAVGEGQESCPDRILAATAIIYLFSLLVGAGRTE
jgi:hypothetical protein